MTILVADDHRLLVECVTDRLAGLVPATRVVPAGDARELRAGLETLPELALIGLGLPGAPGLQAIELAHQRQPALRIVVLAGPADPALVRQAFDAGACGFILKTDASEVLLSAVRLVRAGGVYLPPPMLAALTGGRERDEPASGWGGLREGPGAPALLSRRELTGRQLQVLHLLSTGLPNKLIGRQLGISEGTVKIHLAAIFRALRVRNRTEAVITARASVAA